MIYLRSALFMLLFSLVTLGYSLAILLAKPVVSECALGKLGNAWSHSLLWLLRVVCGLEVQIQGREHIPDYPAIVLCKHQSAWETIALRILFPCRQAWVLKRELLAIPFFGWALRCYHPVAIDRSSPRRALKQVLSQGEASLRAGRWVILFPEGTRVAQGQRGRYNISGAKLAERTGTAVLPIAHNSGVFWGRRAFVKRPGAIRLIIGAPILTANRSAAEINQAAEDWIEARMAELPASPHT
jgi:1-acyl-sn-glycerol-3-phosphate acyltransferase